MKHPNVITHLLLLLNATYVASSILDVCHTCRSPWLHFDNNCYLFVDIPSNFTEAELFCQEMSDCDRPSHLASIHSVEEHTFIVETMLKLWRNDTADLQAWIGRSQPGTLTPAAWTDETSTGYDLTYPSNVDSTSTWFHTYCYQDLRFVCKK